MITKQLSILICLMLLIQLCGCALPEDYRYMNPPEESLWVPTEPKPTKPTEPPVTTEPTPAPSVKTAKQIASELTDEQKIAQLFLVKCPAEGAGRLLEQYDVGGIVLYGQDTAGETPSSLRSELAGYQSLVPVKLLIAVDEEGYPVNRVSIQEAFRSKQFPSIRSAYDLNGVRAVREQEGEKARFLRDLGINVNLGPVCDLVTDPNAYMAQRSMGLTAKTTSEVVAGIVEVMNDNNVGAVLKHFPGYGNSVGDTHTGKVVDGRTEDMLWAEDLKPFQAGIRAGVGAVMVGHSILSTIDGDNPACLSGEIVGILREDMGFDGVVITDDITMGAVTEYYDLNEATIRAINAGCDLILTEWSAEQYQAVYDAVYRDGRISEDRLMESVIRIIQWKMDLGLL